MADLDNRKFYTSDFTGLTTNAYILGTAAVVCIAWYEAARHLQRLPRWRLSSAPPTVPDNPDRMELAHLYTPREYHAVSPSPPLPRWPLLWIWPAIMRSDWWYATHVGIDALAYVRFLRACTWWMFLQLLTTLPVLLAIHMRFSDCDSRTDMACASLAYLVTTPLDRNTCTSLSAPDCARTNNQEGRKWLWVHLLIMYWLTISWLAALYWAARGVVHNRRHLILRLRHRTLQGPYAVRPRSEARAPLTIEHAVLDELARQSGRANDAAHPFYSVAEAQRDPNTAGWRQRTLMVSNLPRKMRNEQELTAFVEQHLGVPAGPAGWASAENGEILPSPVQSVVLVRKMAELDSLVSRRDATLAKLELAHMELAANVLRSVRAIASSQVPPEKNTSPDMVLAQRLARFVTSPSPAPDVKSSFWHELFSLPRPLLDRYQPVTRLTAGTYKGDVVPTIDLLVTKYRLLTALVDAARSLPASQWDATPVAFITFRDPRQARLVWRELSDQVAPRVVLAPERRDIIWDRLMHTTLAGIIVRSLGVSTFFWLFTVFWMIPTQAAASVLNNIGGIAHSSDGHHSALDNHQAWARFVSGTLPTLIVSGVMLLVPEFIFQIHLRAHRFFTRTELYDQCLNRYWKFVVCNTVILFSVGSTTLKTILIRRDSQHQGSMLNSIAFAFPTAAPFFCAYLMLNIATQTGAELVQAVIGLWQAAQAVGARSPRERTEKVLPRKFGHAIWLPLHLTVMTIVFIFAVLNPLVIPFAMAYLWCALVVFKKDLAYVYLRRFHENQGQIYFKRMLRFSLDGLVVAQAVLVIFFAVTKERAVYLIFTIALIPFTVFAKLAGTRLWNSQCRALDDDEANAVCGIDTLPSWIELRQAYRFQGSPEEEFPPAGVVEDPRAAGRFPQRIPVVQGEPARWARFHRWLDMFCANGIDSPGWVSLLYSTPRRDLLEERRIQLDTKAPAVIRSVVATWAARHTFFKSKLADHNASVSRDGRARTEYSMDSRAPLRPPPRYDQGGKYDSEEEASDDMEWDDAPRRAEVNLGVRGRRARRQLVPYERTGFRSNSYRDSSIDSSSRAPSKWSPVKGKGEGWEQDRWEEDWDVKPHVVVARSVSNRASPRSHFSQRPSETTLVPVTISPLMPTGEEGRPEPRRPSFVPPKLAFPAVPSPPRPKSLARAHPPIIWDDRPDDLAHYPTPAHSSRLDRYMWLPSNPAQRLDLAHTLDWLGPAFVSSWYGPTAHGALDLPWDGPLPKGLCPDSLSSASSAQGSSVFLPQPEPTPRGDPSRARGVPLPTLLRRVVVEEETKARRAFRVAEKAHSVVSHKKRRQRRLDRHRARLEDGFAPL